jgi:hypothetical protein
MADVYGSSRFLFLAANCEERGLDTRIRAVGFCDVRWPVVSAAFSHPTPIWSKVPLQWAIEENGRKSGEN